MAYQHTTWIEAKTALLSRLGDSVFWTDDTLVRSEVGCYLTEALRWWGAATMRWRERVTLQLIANQTWYDAYEHIPFLEHRVTDQQLLVEIQYHLLEPIDEDGWQGTAQFDAAEIESAIERRRDQMLFEMGLVQSVHTAAPQSLQADGRVQLDNLTPPIIDIRRAAWLNTSSEHTHLERVSETDADAFSTGWEATRGTPTGYSVGLTPQLRVQLIPRPNTNGLSQFIAVRGGAPLDISTGIKIGVPDDLCWVVKWGALADLLGKQGKAYDPQRAEYCEKRWQEGIEIAGAYRTLLSPIKINGVTVPLGDLFSMDMFRAGWEDEPASVPDTVAVSGLNVIGVAPKPNGAHSLAIDVVRPAQIPSTDAEKLQIGPEELDVILDYAEHIASFKMGGTEFEVTMRHHQNALRLAGEKNAVLRSQWQRKRALEQAAVQNLEKRPYKDQNKEAAAR